MSNTQDEIETTRKSWDDYCWLLGDLSFDEFLDISATQEYQRNCFIRAVQFVPGLWLSNSARKQWNKFRGALFDRWLAAVQQTERERIIKLLEANVGSYQRKPLTHEGMKKALTLIKELDTKFSD